MSESLIAGIFDPRRTLPEGCARQLVDDALRFAGTVTVVECGALTVGVAPADDPAASTMRGDALCLYDGHPRLQGAYVGSESLLDAWQAAGAGVLEELRGPFSAVAWDRLKQTGFIARDQMAQRPVFWHDGQRLSFAGDLRPLRRLMNPSPPPDEAAVACWLGLRVPTNGRTFFAGIRRLPAGHLLHLSVDGWTARAYWRPRYEEPISAPSYELLTDLAERVSQATATALDGAQAPGILLSGGVDSATVAAVAAPIAKQRSLPLHAYSAGFPGLPDADETPLVEELVRAYGLPATTMEVYGGSLLAGTLAYVGASEAPDISANNFFWIDLLKHAAANGVDALLDGEGGDEIFRTPYYLLADQLRAGQLRAMRRSLAVFPGTAGNDSTRVRASIVRTFGVLGALPPAVDRLVGRWTGPSPPLRLTPFAARLANDASDSSAWKRREGPRWWADLVESMIYGPDAIGAPEHALRIARMAGIERRRPLRDLDLTLHMLRLPPELAFSPWFGKGHVRVAMAGQVPDVVRLRRQKTFFTDVRVRSLLESDMPLARRLLGEQALVREYVEPECIRSALNGPAEGPSADKGTWGFQLQHLASTEMWLRAQAQPGFLEELFAEAQLDPVRRVFRPLTA